MEIMIYAAVALSASLSLGVLVAFFWSEGRWRERDRAQAEWLRSLRPHSVEKPSTAIQPEHSPIPIQRRPFHEALWEDCPELAPSPRARPVVQELELAAHRRNEERENDEMKLKHLAAAASLGLAACAHPLTAAKPLRRDSSEMVPYSEEYFAAVRAEMNLQPVKWPLKFKRHNFGAWCYDTQYCSVWYGGLESGSEKPSPPSSKYGPGYLDHWMGGYGVDNFPPPAEVRWRSKDGTEHKAKIDIGEIFKDRLIRHNVPREEIVEQPDGKLVLDPHILLEVNDRTIRVYMRQGIPLKRQVEVAGHMRRDWRDDLILVKTYTY
ncbi:hypothetical protein [Lysobacter panacisoli]|uniref:hypothetical protein n=1 Tax=Lysobacter panacisoli TaxID=1255263 RepID=UPI00131A8B9B|nr:hypothetical protein [Lysobacter panacisoli]